MRTLIKNIKELVGVETAPQLRKQGNEMSVLETIKDAYLSSRGVRFIISVL